MSKYAIIYRIGHVSRTTSGHFPLTNNVETGYPVQSRPEIQADARGDNVWILKPSDPDKQGKQVQFGDSVVLESARYPGYYVRCGSRAPAIGVW